MNTTYLKIQKYKRKSLNRIDRECATEIWRGSESCRRKGEIGRNRGGGRRRSRVCAEGQAASGDNARVKTKRGREASLGPFHSDVNTKTCKVRIVKVYQIRGPNRQTQLGLLEFFFFFYNYKTSNFMCCWINIITYSN